MKQGTLEKIQNLAVSLQLVTVEDMRKHSLPQLVTMIANKLNELMNEVHRFETDVIEMVETQNENIQYLLGEGLHLEVATVFENWMEDGTFDTLINQSAFKKVNDRIDETNAQLSQMAKKEDVAKISSGTPLFASNVSGMTDITRNYVNTSDGYLYIYNGSNFEKTEVLYQSTGINKGDVTMSKLSDDVKSIIFRGKSPSSIIDNLDETLTSHINANTRFILSEKINKNTFIDNIKVFAGNDESFVGGTLKVEIFKNVNGILFKTHEKNFTSSVGVNTLELDFFVADESYISFSRNGFSLLKFKSGTGVNCYYTTDTTSENLTLSSITTADFILSVQVNAISLNESNPQIKTVGVDKKFLTIQSAINSISDDSEENPYIINVSQGIYPVFSMRSSVTGVNRMRHISIIGENKYTTVIKDTTGHYVTGSCDVWTKGTIENLTVEVSHENDISEEHRKSYALHFDFGQCDVEVRNCLLISHQAPAVGVGLYQDTTIKFKDCELYNLCPSDYGTLVDYGAIFCHSQSAENITNQNIKLSNCKVISKNGNKSAWFSKIGSGGEMVVESINTMYYSHKEGVGPKVENNATLSPYSYGNNAKNLNNEYD